MNSTKSASRFIVKGINDDESTCQCCGKEGLARVVWIEDTETGTLSHFGTTCATAPAKCFNLKAEIAHAVRADNQKQQSIWRIGHSLYRKAGGKYAGTAKEGYTAIDQELLTTCHAQAAIQFKAFNA